MPTNNMPQSRHTRLLTDIKTPKLSRRDLSLNSREVLDLRGPTANNRLHTCHSQTSMAYSPNFSQCHMPQLWESLCVSAINSPMLTILILSTLVACKARVTFSIFWCLFFGLAFIPLIPGLFCRAATRAHNFTPSLNSPKHEKQQKCILDTRTSIVKWRKRPHMV